MPHRGPQETHASPDLPEVKRTTERRCSTPRCPVCPVWGREAGGDKSLVAVNSRCRFQSVGQKSALQPPRVATDQLISCRILAMGGVFGLPAPPPCCKITVLMIAAADDHSRVLCTFCNMSEINTVGAAPCKKHKWRSGRFLCIVDRSGDSNLERFQLRFHPN